MHGPTLVNWLLALLTATAGATCLIRLRHSPAPCASGTHRPRARESDAAEALMGLGMAAMAVTGATVPAAVWASLFGLPAAAFLLAAAHAPAGRAHRLHHAVGALAMTYTALTMAGPPGHQHHQRGLGVPLLTGSLLLYFGGYAVWAGSRLLRTPAGTLAVGTAGLPQACRLTTGIGMFAMLLTM